MPLRARLMLWIAMVLVATLMFGGALAYWHALRKVDTEMSAAIEVGKNTVHNAVDDVGRAAAPARSLRLLVADFDGDRHLRAALIAVDGTVVARSNPLRPADAAPNWFYQLLARAPKTADIGLPAPFNRYGSIHLDSDSHNEIAESWSDTVLTLTLLATFCGLSAGLVYWVMGRALRPLGDIVTAFGRIGDGDYTQRVLERGARELNQLARGLNRMVVRLAEVELRKRRLEEQLLDVEEEERSELARDLHDEIGPLLFAISVDLVAVEECAARHADKQLQVRLDVARDALARVQQQVKVILGRLRPTPLLDLGLADSVRRMVAFWKTRYPAVKFDLTAPEGQIADPDRAIAVCRVLQESLSNALRHGKPSWIGVTIGRRSDDSVDLEVCDDGVGLRSDALHAGLGLASMRERVMALGGEIEVGNRDGGRGVAVRASLPASRAEPEVFTVEEQPG